MGITEGEKIQAGDQLLRELTLVLQVEKDYNENPDKYDFDE